METQEKVMKEKADEEKSKYTNMLNELDKTSLKVFKKINE